MYATAHYHGRMGGRAEPRLGGNGLSAEWWAEFLTCAVFIGLAPTLMSWRWGAPRRGMLARGRAHASFAIALSLPSFVWGRRGLMRFGGGDGRSTIEVKMAQCGDWGLAEGG